MGDPREHRRDDAPDEGVTPAEFTKAMPEGESAGPDAPETVEPTQGREEERGPGGPAMEGIGGSGPEGDETTRGGD